MSRRRDTTDYDWAVLWSERIECMVVVPVDDCAEHDIPNMRCWCDPHILDGVLVHYAGDGRRQFRRAA